MESNAFHCIDAPVVFLPYCPVSQSLASPLIFSQVARLKKELEDYEAEAIVQESKKDVSLGVASHKTLEYGQVCGGVGGHQEQLFLHKQ